jgi:DNA polymerase I-like protein with 3'-5' exonuclease and polymerase domains
MSETMTSPSDLLGLRLEGGLRVDPRDGRVHTVYRHDPSTLRLSAAAPNMTNIPRGGTELQDLVRGFFEAPPGYEFCATDYAGVEAILTGFYANAPRIMRIFRLDGHSFFTAHVLHVLDKTLPAADLPQESWSDADLLAYFKVFKPKNKARRETNKKITHGANYMETAAMAQVILLNEMGVLWPIKEIAKIMDFYHELFPEIRRWHHSLMAKVGGVPLKQPEQLWGCEARNTYIRTPFNVVHRYYDVVKWEKTPGGWDWSAGDDAKRLASLLPQSTARFCLTRAAQRIWHNPEQQDVAKTFRLFIHDELLCEARTEQVDRVLAVVKEEMERPIPELVLPDGSMLKLGTESKRGQVWRYMK